MIEAELPKNENERLAALIQLNILNTPLEERFERITRMVCRALNVPIAAVSLVDECRQWFKSIQGISASETPRNVAFCSHAILSDKIMVVPDATLDERFVENPLVTSDPAIRFYAGYPLSLDKEIRLGTLCAIDVKPRQLSDDELLILHDLGRMVECELTAVALSQVHIKLIQELGMAQRLARIDGLTRLWNRSGINDLFQREWDFAIRKSLPITVVMIDFDEFKQINDNYGHPVGDEALRSVSRMLLENIRTCDVVGRWGGDEFMIILPGCPGEEIEIILRRIQAKIKSSPIITSKGSMQVSLSMGAASIIPKDDETFEQLIEEADNQLFKAKKSGKGCFRIWVS